MSALLNVLALAAVVTLQRSGPSGAEEWPTAAPGRVISTPDWSDARLYPPAARRKNQEGSVLPQVWIGEDGKPKKCRIIESSKFEELDAGTCKLMMEMQFDPARDVSGKPIASRFSRPVVWLLADPRPFASSTLRARMDISGGKQQKCEVVGGQGPYFAAWSGMACFLLRAVPYYLGSHANDTASATVEFRLDAGDRSPALDVPLVAGTPVAIEKLSFTVNDQGDPAMCTPLQHDGFGPRDLADTSPCPTLLKLFYFERAPQGTPVRKGVLETRVVLIGG